MKYLLCRVHPHRDSQLFHSIHHTTSIANTKFSFARKTTKQHYHYGLAHPHTHTSHTHSNKRSCVTHIFLSAFMLQRVAFSPFHDRFDDRMARLGVLLSKTALVVTNSRRVRISVQVLLKFASLVKTHEWIWTKMH